MPDFVEAFPGFAEIVNRICHKSIHSKPTDRILSINSIVLTSFISCILNICWTIKISLILWHRILVISIQSSKLLTGTDALSDIHNNFDEH